MKQLLIFIQLTTLICLLGHTDGATINVPADYTTIQEGIDAAAVGDTVLVAAGTYNEDILLKSGVLLQGAGHDVTTIQGTGTQTVVTIWEVEENTAIDGFTITGGNDNTGGGILCYESGAFPTITNNVITGNNSTSLGGGIECFFSSPTITNNVITGNNARYGGGIDCVASRATITDNMITGNNASWGGGITSAVHSSPMITDNVITGNSATNSGGGIDCDMTSATISHNVIGNNSVGQDGGGISCQGRFSPDINNNVIWDNSSAGNGGGIYSYGVYAPRLTSNVIVGNTAGQDGGGIFYDVVVTPPIINNVIAGNDASSGGGISLATSGSGPITNNVIADNSVTDYGGGIVKRDSSYSSPTITNCIIWGNGDDLYNCVATYSCIEDGDPGEGNTALNPLFVDTVNVDYRLLSGSPCIDTGNNIAGLPTEDLDGNPRIADGDGNGTAVVDMGAYEYVIPVRAVLIDIKPGSVKNPINLRSRGVVPVALLSTADFDALLVSLSYVTFGPNGASPVRAVSADVDGDGDLDMLFHFRQQETGITSSDTGATWKAVTGGGIQLIGEDIIHVVPKKK